MIVRSRKYREVSIILVFIQFVYNTDSIIFLKIYFMILRVIVIITGLDVVVFIGYENEIALDY